MSRTHIRAGEPGGAAGWRMWRVVHNDADGLPALASSERQFVWEDRSVRARCLPPSDHFGASDWYRDHRQTPEHASPSVVCGCGIHAYWSQSDALGDTTLGRGTLRAVGPVELTERMLETETGVRAEAARMVGPIWLMGECGLARPQLTECGNVVSMDLETFVLRCADHSRAEAPNADEAIWAVRQQLEARYQVEVQSTINSTERQN